MKVTIPAGQHQHYQHQQPRPPTSNLESLNPVPTEPMGHYYKRATENGNCGIQFASTEILQARYRDEHPRPFI